MSSPVFECRLNWGGGVGWKYIYTKGVPIEAQYLYKKAMEMFRLGKPESALKYLKQTIVIAPRYSKALFEMGNCFTKLGEHEEARVHYEQAFQIDPALKDLLEKQG
jgi:tetratricopeptide (TPR) repeat protein